MTKKIIWISVKLTSVLKSCVFDKRGEKMTTVYILWAIALFLVYWVIAVVQMSAETDQQVLAYCFLAFFCACVILVYWLEPGWRKTWRLPTAMLAAEVAYGVIGRIIIREKPIQLGSKKTGDS